MGNYSEGCICNCNWRREVLIIHTLLSTDCRQLRNRDAAVRSRERKKMYVKDLEMKSKYLEGECRRLGRLLQCCYAENHALRLGLQMGNAFGASTTKQESAVLLLGMILHSFSLPQLLFSINVNIFNI